MSRKIVKCCECNAILKKEETALCKKLLGLETEEYYCLKCFSVYLECSIEDLKIKILEFKEQGCTLFL